MSSIAKRIIAGIAAIIASITIVFFMVSASGSPAALMAGEFATPDIIDEINRKYGFDQPIYKQYFIFLTRILAGDFPPSIRTGQDSFEIVLNALQNTIVISSLGIFFGTIGGLFVGYVSVFGRNIFFTSYLMRIAAIIQAIPTFLSALILIFIFALRLRLLPTSGGGSVSHYIMPTTVLALYILPSVARLFRSSIITMLNAPYVRTAIVKGISSRQVNLRHVALNALPPVIAFIGLKLGSIVGGATIIEYVFAWPGVGQLLIHSLLMRDYPIVLASVVFISIAYVTSTIVVDIIVYFLDPRSR